VVLFENPPQVQGAWRNKDRLLTKKTGLADVATKVSIAYGMRLAQVSAPPELESQNVLVHNLFSRARL
jgi:hypothetical protein